MYVNKQIRRVKLVFKWAVAEELIPPAVYQSLQAVQGLKSGRCEVRESDPIKPVPQCYVDAIEPYVSAQVWALVQLQLLTGARAGELVLNQCQAFRGRAHLAECMRFFVVPSACRRSHS